MYQRRICAAIGTIGECGFIVYKVITTVSREYCLDTAYFTGCIQTDLGTITKQEVSTFVTNNYISTHATDIITTTTTDNNVDTGSTGQEVSATKCWIS